MKKRSVKINVKKKIKKQKQNVNKRKNVKIIKYVIINVQNYFNVLI